jgi:hypothetical protein
MSATGLEVFDTTLHKTHTWLKEVMEELGTEDRHRAYMALRAVLHALRDRLTGLGPHGQAPEGAAPGGLPGPRGPGAQDPFRARGGPGKGGAGGL